LAIIISKRGRDITQAQALDFVGGYCVALDMTARDLQDEAKSKGLPWTEAKGAPLKVDARPQQSRSRLLIPIFLAGFDTFCALGEFVPKDKAPQTNNLGIWLKVRYILPPVWSFTTRVFHGVFTLYRV
jgi:acylpyruvate hydrolase